MPSVPDWMRDNFARGLAFHEDGRSGDGLVPRTVADARRAVTDGDVSDGKVRRMAAWFARHMVDLDGAPQRGDKDFPSPGQVAHLLWGGGVTKQMSERAMRWAENQVERIGAESSATMVRMDTEVNDLPSRAVIVVATETEPTSDGRVVDAGGLTWREPPLSLTVNHDPDQRAGRIDALRRVASLDHLDVTTFETLATDTDGSIIVGLVTFNLETEFGRQVAAEVRDGFLTGVSMEVGDEVIEYDDDNVMHLVEGKIGAVTLAPFQAIESARVVQVASIHVWGGPATVENTVTPETLIASSIPTAPPTGWFTDPTLDSPTPLVVTDDGRIFGHLALWNTCHTGRADICLTPPRSAADYAYFRTGYVTCDDDTTVAVGSITMATGHASTRPGVSAAAAIAHYEHTGFAVADVAAGEDDHGVWIAGALRPGVSAEQIRELRGASLSGDWRTLSGNLELVAALAVNVPGFPVPRVQAGLAASGAQTALVAAGTAADDPDCGCGAPGDLSAVEARLTQLETLVDVLGFSNAAMNLLVERISN